MNFKNLKIGAKLTSITTILIFILVAVIAVVTYININQQVIDVACRNNESGVTSLELLLDGYKTQAEGLATMTSQNSSILQVLETGNREQIMKEMRSFISHFEVDFATITDSEGNVICRVHQPEKFGDNVLGSNLDIAGAIKNRNVCSGVAVGAVVPISIRAAAPVLDSFGKVSYVISVGKRFDDSDFLDDLKSKYGLDFTLFRHDERVATTIIDDSGERVIGTKLTPEVSAIVLGERKSYSGEADILGEPYVTFYKPIIGIDGEAVGVLFTGSNKDVALAAGFAMMLRMGIISLVMLILIAVTVVYSMRRIIIRPLNTMVSVAKNVSVGDFSVDLSSSVTSKDEIGELALSMQHIIEVVGNLIDDTRKFSNAIKLGNLGAEVDVSGYEGAYKDFVVEISAVLDTLIRYLRDSSQFVEGVASGNIPSEITEEYHGDFNKLKNNLNACSRNVNALISEGTVLISSAVEGKLDVRADASRHQGAYREIVSGINELLDAVVLPIQDVYSVLQIMATGDLTARITSDYRGTFLRLKEVTNGLGESLSNLISQLQDAIHTTASASAEISSTADTLATASAEQSAQTDEVAGAMEEMSRTVIDNAQSATRTSAVAQRNGSVAEEGGKVVSETVAKMRQIAEVVKVSASNIMQLGESSKRIGEIISVIDDIADQTNLLALNAAIEAARAGEQGRGFAVVADEVRKLAENTAEATKQISEMISGIQRDTDSAVSAMEQGTKEVESGIELADKAGSSLQMIINSTTELLDMINQIAAASEEQSSTSEEISKNVAMMAKVSSGSAQNIGDIATTAGELARMTEALTSLVNQFKINTDSSRSSNYALTSH
ncbi:MAG: methyl-accepting chemotaxis protein [Candidatus Kapaibacterium sp.]